MDKRKAVVVVTKDEAIKIIEDACWWYHKKGCSGLTQVEIFEARDRAIQALNSLEEVYANGYNDGFTQAEVNYENDKALSQEPICDRDCEHCTWTECPIEPCDDAISRDMALKECYDIVIDGERYRVIQEETLLGLPPVTHKSGMWIDIPFSHYYKCSECDKYQISATNYCPNCGCRMVEPQESEDKE